LFRGLKRNYKKLGGSGKSDRQITWKKHVRLNVGPALGEKIVEWPKQSYSRKFEARLSRANWEEGVTAEEKVLLERKEGQPPQEFLRPHRLGEFL